jgi:Flp pilus assembly pilin Flp
MFRDDTGQATAEYALVIVAASIIALALIAWASDTDLLQRFFDGVMRRVRAVAGS